MLQESCMYSIHWHLLKVLKCDRVLCFDHSGRLRRRFAMRRLHSISILQFRVGDFRSDSRIHYNSIGFCTHLLQRFYQKYQANRSSTTTNQIIIRSPFSPHLQLIRSLIVFTRVGDRFFDINKLAHRMEFVDTKISNEKFRYTPHHSNPFPSKILRTLIK